VEFCGDQHGSRFIQQRLESGLEEEVQIALAEITPNLFALMMDVFGNYVVQKLFEVCDQGQKVEIASKMEGNVFKLSMEMYGCRVSTTLFFCFLSPFGFSPQLRMSSLSRRSCCYRTTPRICVERR